MNNTFQRLKEEFKRTWLLLLVTIIPIALFAEAPQIISVVIVLSMISFVLWVIHMQRQWMWPYLNLGDFVNRAKNSAVASAIVFATVVLFMMLVVWLAVAKAECYDQKMLKRASPYIPKLVSTFDKYWDKAPLRYFEGGKIEQESSWNRLAELHTSRELGVSFSQLTIAYNANGTVRFNKFEEAKARYKELQRWEWKDRFNAEKNFIFIVLEDRRNFMLMKPYFQDNLNRWAALMIAYNAGSGTVWNRRAICKTTEGCDSSKWFGGLDTVRMLFENKLLYGRPLWKARNEYPDKIIFQRSPKYMGLL
jgi:uncharacterized membrane protein